ncbi:M56 family metallopeptidase [Candidatus Dojkabacteria bacterium]|uniref:M56 family metallopeptidase n=1 Tax=Candidatus Dojkabacteria bacterium TaxID=2099670 RepID=A0A955KWX1_9BACT|nr:M56 family metallopeptidase [Candidatus Dojkabacteria bacterium]
MPSIKPKTRENSKFTPLILIAFLSTLIGLVSYLVVLTALIFRSFILSESVIEGNWKEVGQKCINAYQQVGGTGLLFSIIFTSASILLLLKTIRAIYRTISWYLITEKQVRKLDVISEISGVNVFEGDKPFAFTAGLLFPKIYISNWYLENLDQEELCSLILHEKYHQANRHPLMIVLDRLTAEIVPFYKGSATFRALLEVSADSFVKDQQGDGLSILTGLKKSLEWSDPSRISNLAIAPSAYGHLRISSISDGVPRTFIFRTVLNPLSAMFVLPALLMLLNFQSSVSGVYAASSYPVDSSECRQYTEINMSREVQTLERFFTPIKK